jgi:CheY-like chemotaxis protein
MVKLVYIDEQDDQRRAMERAALMSEDFAGNEIQSLDPCLDLHEMVAEIEAHRPDVLITDYRLNEYKAGVTYSGIDLVTSYQARYRNFPCFVTTGFARDAAGEAANDVDINTIFSKEDARQTSAADAPANPLPFFLRVRLKVESYQALISSFETEHHEFKVRLASSLLTPVDIERFLFLDGELEAMLGADHRLPDEIKRLALQPLTEIVEKAEALLAQLEEAHPESGASSAEGADA